MRTVRPARLHVEARQRANATRPVAARGSGNVNVVPWRPRQRRADWRSPVSRGAVAVVTGPTAVPAGAAVVTNPTAAPARRPCVFVARSLKEYAVAGASPDTG